LEQEPGILEEQGFNERQKLPRGKRKMKKLRGEIKLMLKKTQAKRSEKA